MNYMAKQLFTLNSMYLIIENVPRTITIFLPALLTLLIPNTTANNTITYINFKKAIYILSKVD